MYHTILTAIVILFPLVAVFQDIVSLSVYRILWVTGITAVFLIHAVFNFDGLLYHAAVSAVSFVFYYVIRYITRKGLGFADVLMAAFMGSILGFEKMVWAVVIQILLSLLYYIIAGLFTKMKTHKIPFIPFMAASLWFLWFS